MEKSQVADRDRDQSALRYGCLGFRPSWLQWLNRPAWFIVFMALAGAAQTVAVGGLLGVNMSTIEKRFGFSSRQSSFIAMSYELAGLLVILLVGYVGGKGSRPVWVAGGLYLLSLGSFLFTLPHFLSGLYDPDSTVVMDRNICYGNQTGNSTRPDECDRDFESLAGYLGVFIAAYCIMGFGSIPIFSVGLTYIDDISPRDRSAMYIGIFYTFTILGPAAAYMGAGYLLNIYTDADRGIEPDIGRLDPRWVGAWWIGFLITGAMALMAAIPMTGFPTDMPGAAEMRTKKKSEAHKGEQEVDPHVTKRLKVKDLQQSLKVLLTNGTFICISIAGMTDAMLITGFTNYGPKYMQQQFSLSEGFASALFGLMSIPGGIGGTLIASFLVKHYDFSCRQLLKWTFIMTFICLVAVLSIAALCDNPDFAGVNRDYDSGATALDFDLNAECNADCDCSRRRFSAVCGSDNTLYFSPCYAGCQDWVFEGGSMVYYNCSCIPSQNATVTFAKLEPCDISCRLMPVFVALFLVSMFGTFFASIFNVYATMRCVPAREKSFAVSIAYFITKLLGNLPGPLIFGSILDVSCVLWDETCEGQGSCRYYKNSTMAYAMLATGIAFKGTSTIMTFIGWRIYQPHPASEQDKDKNKDKGNDLPEKTVSGDPPSNGYVNQALTPDGNKSTTDNTHIIEYTKL